MAIKEIRFISSNGHDTVRAWAYTPLDTPRGIIQVIHGYGEHSRRFLHMINTFQAAGFIVYADDHLGHGKTGLTNNDLGNPHSKDPATYVRDEKLLHDIAVKDYPGLPYFVFGHSWGSIIARAYAAHYGDDLKALLLCGIISQMKGCDNVINDPDFKADFETNPHQSSDKWFDKAFLNMTERYGKNAKPNDWISSDPRVLVDYMHDPFNALSSSLQLLWDFVQLYGYVISSACIDKIPTRLPIYIISGDQDPCGNYGEGAYHAANVMINSGHDVTVHVYPGYRHEIQNARNIRDEVEAGLLDFINKSLA